MQPRNLRSYRIIKRVGDVLGALVLLLILSPIMLVVGCLIKLTSPGPVLLRQARLTDGGREFTLFKFRSMTDGAEKPGEARLAVVGDSRITPIGRFIRKTRIDELPQLVNVLRGEMSLIGPRPERPEIARRLAESIRGFDRRLRTKAGLTGLAQVVQGYPDDLAGYRTKLALDRVYIQQQSLALDMWIALKTIGTIISGSGAR